MKVSIKKIKNETFRIGLIALTHFRKIICIFLLPFSLFSLQISLYFNSTKFISFHSQGRLFNIDNENVRWLLAFGKNLIIYREYSYNNSFLV